MDKMELFYNKNSEMKVLDPFEVEKRIFYPIINISVIYSKNVVYSAKTDPIAFVVKENGNKYIISLTDKHLDANAIYSAVSKYK